MKKIDPARFAARLGIYCLGLLVLAFGIALSVNCSDRKSTRLNSSH